MPSSPTDSAPDNDKKSTLSSFLDSDKSRGQFLYWFFGLSPLFARTLSPLIVLGTNLLTKKHTNTVLYNKLVAEASRQFVKGVLGVASYFGFAELVQGVLNKKNKAAGKSPGDQDENIANFWKAITGQISTTAISLFAGGFFVPLENLLAKTEDKKDAASSKPCLKCGEIAPPAEKKNIAPLKPWQQSVHTFLDKHLTKNGEPLVAKAALASTGALAVSLTGFSFFVYGLSRLLGTKPEQKHLGKSSEKPEKKPAPPVMTTPNLVQQATAPPYSPVVFAPSSTAYFIPAPEFKSWQQPLRYPEPNVYYSGYARSNNAAMRV